MNSKKFKITIVVLLIQITATMLCLLQLLLKQHNTSCCGTYHCTFLFAAKRTNVVLALLPKKKWLPCPCYFTNRLVECHQNMYFAYVLCKWLTEGQRSPYIFLNLFPGWDFFYFGRCIVLLQIITIKEAPFPHSVKLIELRKKCNDSN